VRTVFSLTGIVPLGAFLLVHMAINARALHSDAAFASAVRAVQKLPALALVEAVLIYLPLAVHAAIGGWLVATRRSFSPPTPYSPGVRVGLRLTGVVVAAFLVMHLPELRFAARGMHLGPGELATRLDADLSTVSHGVPWRGLAYLVGTACATFHFAAGLWGAFAVHERARASLQQRRRAAWAIAVLGTVMWLTLANVVVFRATGAQLFGEMVEESSAAPCP
jgi:succinate dehydrogenase / fumarate reductase cytochrome b subunit